MLLRSSSTPVLGSLLTSLSDSPNNNHHSETNTTIKHPPTTIPHNHNKLPLHQTGSLNLTSVSCNSSPQLSDLDRYSCKGFRRAQSEGNLEALAYASCNNSDDFYHSSQPQKFSSRPKCSMLQTIPSFSIYNSRGICEDKEGDSDQEDEDRDEFEGNRELLERSVEGGEKLMAMGGNEFSWEKKSNMGLVKEKGFSIGFGNVGCEEERELDGSEMYLARGLGVGGGGYGGGSGGDFTPRGSGGGDGVEDYYRRMVEENPSNPLFLRNYAQFLYQSKRDLHRAEEYYSRAILVDPKDGEILSQYAKLVWELHREEDRASSYFERAAQAAPEDSHVLAAYASFLWETEEDEEEADRELKDIDAVSPFFHIETMASASA